MRTYEIPNFSESYGSYPALSSSSGRLWPRRDHSPHRRADYDAEGRSLYLFTKDTQNSGASSCTGECLVNWPPLLTDGDPVAGEGVDESMLGTIPLPDGTTQVTYDGWPLYYYAKDTAAGDANGQAVGDVWYLVSPSGEMIQ